MQLFNDQDGSELAITQVWVKAGILAVADTLYYSEGPWNLRQDDTI